MRASYEDKLKDVQSKLNKKVEMLRQELDHWFIEHASLIDRSIAKAVLKSGVKALEGG